MGSWHDDCELELINALEGPASGQSLLNPSRADMPVDILFVQVKLELFDQGEWYEHQQYLAARYPMRGNDRAGLEISDMSFHLIDTFNVSILPFINGGAKGQRVRCKNQNETETYFKGIIEDIKPIAVHQRDDGSDKRYLSYSCIDEFYLFKRLPIYEIIEDTTECGMLADLTKRYAPELDISGINIALGRTITKKTIDGRYLDDLYKEVLQNNPDLAFNLDIHQEPSCVCMDSKDAATVKVPIELTDTNIYKYCSPGDFDIHTTGKTYRNRIIHTAPRLYNEGLVDVDKDNLIVYGSDTNWYKKVFPGDTFRIPGSDSRYTVAKNLSTADGSIEELYLNSDYQESIAIDLEYQIIGKETTIEVEDLNEIERHAELTGEIGENAGVRAVIINESTPLTEDEQEQVAENALRRNAYEGYLNTHNILFPVKNLRSGQTVSLNMPLRGVSDQVPIGEVQWEVRKGEKQEVSGMQSPPIEYKISFDDRVLLSENAFRALLISERGTGIRDFDKLTARKNIGERFLSGVCTRHTEGEDIDENFSAYVDSTSESTASYTAGPFYPEEIAPGQSALQVFDPDNPVATFTYPV